ncbi:MAG TPA: DUF3426 domain-containing protein [Thiobacillus sp.]
MNYRTTCSHCSSIFRVGPDQLDAAQGWVQCSVCGSAFDAHSSLLMEDGSPLPIAEPEPDLEPVEAPQPLPEAPINEGSTAVPDETIAPADQSSAPPLPEADEPDEAVIQGISHRENPLDLPSIILIDPDASEPDDPGPLPHISAPGYPAAQDSPAYPPPPVFASAIPSARVEYANIPPEIARSFAPPSRRTPTWIWVVASLLLLTGLLAQSAYFLRDTLVSRFPETRPALEQACEVLGCTFSLPKNLALLRIVGSDLQTETSGRLKLTLTLGNRASHIQAWPVLVLTLMDQRNRPLARRSFAPSEYLGGQQRIAAGIPPRSEQVLNLPLNVRNMTPMGFDLRLMY